MWGPWLLVLLLGTGVILTVRLRGIQFRMLGYALRLTFSKEKNGTGDMIYTHIEVDKLQLIMFFRELGMKLKDVK